MTPYWRLLTENRTAEKLLRDLTINVLRRNRADGSKDHPGNICYEIEPDFSVDLYALMLLRNILFKRISEICPRHVADDLLGAVQVCAENTSK